MRLVTKVADQAPRLHFPIMVAEASHDSFVRPLADEIAAYAKPRSRSEDEVVGLLGVFKPEMDRYSVSI
jgi:hypothetical protein